MMSKRDISKTDCWKNVSYLIRLLILNFFILNRELLTKMIQNFSILKKKLISRFEIVPFFYLAHACSSLFWAWKLLLHCHQAINLIEKMQKKKMLSSKFVVEATNLFLIVTLQHRNKLECFFP
jgi:hypothetical protein